MTFHDIRAYLTGTLRGRLILSVALVHAIMMTLFIADLTVRQRFMILSNQEDEAIAMSQSLAISAAGWIASHDIAGMQELVEIERNYPELLFAMLADKDGRILAHTDQVRMGLYLQDLPKELQQKVIYRTPALVDVAVPAMLSGKHVGWARVGIGQKKSAKKMASITFMGVVYAIGAIAAGSFIAWRMGYMLTRRLYAIQETICRVHSGERSARTQIAGTDEASAMAREFNLMLDTLSVRDAELSASEESMRRLIMDSPLAMVVTDGSGESVKFVNKMFTEIFGYTIKDIPDVAHWWPLAYPYDEYRNRIAAKWKSLVEKAGSRGLPIEPMEAAVTCRDGSVRYIEFHMSSIGTEALITFIDLTERKKAEEEIRRSNEIVERIFAMTTTCLAYMDRDFNFIRVNREYASADGKVPEYFIGKNHFQLFPSADNEAIFRKVVDTGEQFRVSARPFEYQGHPERGVSHWDWSLTPVKDENGCVVALILSLINVSDRIRAQEELKILNANLEERVKERTAELEEKNAELEKMNKLFVGRELKMVELKERLRELEKENRMKENGSAS